MALAKYFSKDALAITQVLNGSIDTFETILKGHVVEIAFDDRIKHEEASVSSDLFIKLIARLYPTIKITDLSGNNPEIVDELLRKAKSINQDIEVTDSISTVIIVIGKTSVTAKDRQKVFYIGSDEWIAKLSDEAPVGSGDGAMPFAAGIAACIAASNVFRFVFSTLIDDVEYDSYVELSLLDLTSSRENKVLELQDLGEVTVVGIGAIGSGVVWALSKLQDMKGKINLVDDQTVALSNLQRYVIAEEQDENLLKVEVAKEKFSNTKFEINPSPKSWGQYISENSDWKNSMILTALDSAKDRIAVQSSLPKYILNAFTEERLLGISRHFNFIEKACLSCLYIPTNEGKSDSQEVADNLGLSHLESSPLIRNAFYFNSPVSFQLLQLVAQANGLELDKIVHFEGVPMNEFYTKFVCGGILLTLKGNNGNTQKIEAPLAFQSAIAGILLASEFYLWKAGHRTEEFKIKTDFYPLLKVNPGSNPYNHSLQKDSTGRCICCDEDFISVYNNKWGGKN